MLATSLQLQEHGGSSLLAMGWPLNPVQGHSRVDDHAALMIFGLFGMMLLWTFPIHQRLTDGQLLIAF